MNRSILLHTFQYSEVNLILYSLKHFEMQKCLCLLYFPLLEYALFSVPVFYQLKPSHINAKSTVHFAVHLADCRTRGPKQGSLVSIPLLWKSTVTDMDLCSQKPGPRASFFSPLRSFFGMRLDRCDILQYKRNQGCGLHSVLLAYSE